MKYLLYSLTLTFLLFYTYPEDRVIPVQDAKTRDWNEKSFWFEPWGSSGVHKGIDIFGKKGQEVIATNDSFVISTGVLAKGGNFVLLLGPKLRLHYYSHLHSIDTKAFTFVKAGEKIATLGDSGNAKGKQPHVHYSITTIVPYPWRYSEDTQGWKKIFYLNPDTYLKEKL